MNEAIIIPAYQPDEKLVLLVEQLAKLNFPIILIVNDGSKKECDIFFQECKNYENCKIINLNKNMGKGHALKTGMKFLLENYPEILGCITADSDGQHLPEDILKIGKNFENDPESLILGCRNFDRENVPLKSKMGNKITRFLYETITSINIADTQTGLRAIPAYAMKQFINLNGERYEFEMNMLMEAALMDLSIKEVKINTVYIDNNKTSHFKPFSDSLKVYRQIIKFFISSFSSSIVDIGLFTLFSRLLTDLTMIFPLLFATCIARICSSVLNYNLNKRMVFNCKEKDGHHALKYFSLCAVQMLGSWLLVESFSRLLSGNIVLFKIIADIILFVAGFFIQKLFVFKKVEVI